MTEEPYRDFNPYTDRDPVSFIGPEPTTIERIQAFAARLPLISLAVPSYPIVIDVNHWVTVDLALAKQNSNIAGVIVKLTEGDGKAVKFKDPKADAYIRTAVDLGLPVGAFHFFRQNWSGDDQATWFLENAEQYRSLPGIKWIYPHIDRETVDGVTDQGTSNWRAFKCASTVRSNWTTPGWYTNLDNFNKLFHIGSTVVDWINEFNWWWAQWTSALSPTWPAAIAASRRNLWQNGIAGSHTWITPISGAKVVDHGYDLAKVTDISTPEPPPPPSGDLEQRVAALESTLDATVKVVNSTANQADVNKAAITQLTTNLTNASLAITKLRTDLTTLQTAVTAIAGKNSSQDNAINILVEQVETVEIKIKEAAEALQ